PFDEGCRRHSPFSGRENYVRAGRIADNLKVFMDAADDGRARIQSHRDSHRTDYFCKHRGKVVRRLELATSKQASPRSDATPETKQRLIRVWKPTPSRCLGSQARVSYSGSPCASIRQFRIRKPLMTLAQP